VALSVSTVLEGYQWTLPAFGGVVLVLGGNLLAFRKPVANVPSGIRTASTCR
jgi:hypothetical protein